MSVGNKDAIRTIFGYVSPPLLCWGGSEAGGGGVKRGVKGGVKGGSKKKSWWRAPANASMFAKIENVGWVPSWRHDHCIRLPATMLCCWAAAHCFTENRRRTLASALCCSLAARCKSDAPASRHSIVLSRQTTNDSNINFGGEVINQGQFLIPAPTPNIRQPSLPIHIEPTTHAPRKAPPRPPCA